MEEKEDREKTSQKYPRNICRTFQKIYPNKGVKGLQKERWVTPSEAVILL
jgi:hypothetical protein